MKKIIFILSLIITLSACSAPNSEYIISLQERGFSQSEIHAYIEYSKSNPYLPDEGYVDVTGRTVKEVCRDLGKSINEYIEEYQLPKNLPALTSETEAMYTVPISRMAKTYGMNLNEFLNSLNLPSDTPSDMPWGKALSQVTLGDYVGDGNVEKFKEMYNLHADVSSDTLYGEILNDVDKIKQSKRLNK